MPADRHSPEVPIALGLGSNLGDRADHLRTAIRLLGDGPVHGLRASAFVASAPVDCAPGAPEYLNAAAVGRTALPPAALLAFCQQVEQQLGRDRSRGYHADRTIDVDVLLYGQQQLRTADLVVPHPELTRRDFVLVPLAELAPDWVIPGTDRTVAACLADLRASGDSHG